MQEKNPNLFPIVAVLTAASILTGICGLLFLAIDQMDESRILSTSPGMVLEGEPTPTPLSLELQSSRIIGTYEATVLSIETLSGAASTSQTSRRQANDPASAESEQDSFWIASGTYDNTATVLQVGGQSDDLPDRDVRQRASARGIAVSEVVTLDHSGSVNALAFLPNTSNSTTATRLVTGSGSGEIKLWSLPSQQPVTTIADQSGRIVSLAANADGQFFATGSSNGTLKVWPVDAIAAQKSQTSLRGITLNEAGPSIDALAFHPIDASLLISGDQEGNVRVWDIEKSAFILTLSSDADRITSLAISPDGQYVASSSQDKLIRIWSLENSQIVRTLSGHTSVVSDIAFSPDSRLLASSSHDESIKTWDWAKANERCMLTGHSGNVPTVAFADSSTLISGGADGTLMRWNLAAPINRTCLNE